MIERYKGIPHVVLGGKQTLQNLIPALEMRASGVFVVASDDETTYLARAKLAFNGLKVPWLGHITVNAYSYDEVRRGMEAAREELKGISGRWILNFTGGTKAMSYGSLLGMSALDPARLYYDSRYGITLDGGPPHKVARMLTVKELVLAHGIPDRTVLDQKRAVDDESQRYLELSPLRPKPAFHKGYEAARKNRVDEACDEYNNLNDDKRRENGYFLEGIVAYRMETLVKDRYGAQRSEEDVFRYGVRLIRPHNRVPRDDFEFDFLISNGERLTYLSCKAQAPKGVRDELIDLETRRQEIGGIFCNAVLAHHHAELSGELQNKNIPAIAKRFRTALIGRETLRSDEAFQKTMLSYFPPVAM